MTETWDGPADAFTAERVMLDPKAARGFVEACLKPFTGAQVGKKPQGTCKDCTRGQCSRHVKQWCETCKQNITTAHIHIDFVGHAHLTARLLKLDPFWSWEPMAYGEDGLPKILVDGDMAHLWIRLTVGGVTRPGIGSEPLKKFGKPNENLLKELIGDCWASGTLITTARGQVPIEDVMVGDLVLNSSGWRRVTDHWSNGVRECIEVACDGVRLVGTPTHRVPTPTGVKTLAEIKPGDPLWHDPSLLTRSSWSTAASSTTGGRTAPTTRTPASRGSIGGSTKTPTALFPLGGTSITSTRTRTTTTREISRPSPRRTMLVCIGGSASDGPSAASGVAATSSHSSPGPDGARLAARRLSVETTARSHRAPGSPHPASGASTVTPRSAPTNPGPAFAPLRVSSVRSGVVAEVWNLSVEGTHEYIANGVLSFNSLRNAAMRFGLALDLWAKGDLIGEYGEAAVPGPPEPVLLHRGKRL